MKRKRRSIVYLALVVILILSTFVNAYGDYGTGNSTSNGFDSRITTVGMTEYLNDQIIVNFKDDITKEEMKTIKKAYKLIDKAKFKSGGEVLKLKGNMTVEELVTELNDMDSVKYAGFDYIMRASEMTVPTDPRLDELWGMKKIDASGDSADPAYPDDPRAWEIDQGNPEVIVAVIDTGVDMGHEDLAVNIWTNPGEIPGNGIDDDGNNYIDDTHGWDYFNNDNDPSDDHSHGTHCAGTIAAAANTTGVAGVAPYVQIMPLKFLSSEGSGSFSDAVLAIDYAQDMGAHVISASWGGYTYTLYNDMSDAIDGFEGVFCAAAGNDGIDLDLYEVLFGLYHAPATYPNENIVSVASIDEDGQMSYFSNYGTRDYARHLSTVDLVAPGSYILSTVPGDGYETKSGTSMATPHVAGTVALMISHEINVNGYTSRTNTDLCKRQVLFHKNRQLIFYKKRQLIFHTCPLDFPTDVSVGYCVFWSFWQLVKQFLVCALSLFPYQEMIFCSPDDSFSLTSVSCHTEMTICQE